MQTPSCPQCSVPMDRGFLMDHSHRSVGHAAQWISGEPERSLLYGVKTGGRRKITVSSYRCPRCGRLELLAPPE